MDKDRENQLALEAKEDKEVFERFLREREDLILRVTARITGTSVSKSDDEWSIALQAVAAAIGSYEPERGGFWPYAALVMRSRLRDWFRSTAAERAEISTRPEVLEGNAGEEDEDYGMQAAIMEKTAVSVDTSLRDEIVALQEELSAYGISFFELAECSPHAQKTRETCAGLVCALFLPPPPLTALLRVKHVLPVKEMLGRYRVSRKVVDRYRKYLITAALILDGDYPGLSEYLGYIKSEISAERGWQE
ncbi:MAG: hypothetical protein IKE03_06325 [Blautia sp.]|nr:hypothetical protein [Blautia sp.]